MNEHWIQYHSSYSCVSFKQLKRSQIFMFQEQYSVTAMQNQISILIYKHVNVILQ